MRFRSFAVAGLLLAVLAAIAPPASAARKATKAEAKALRKAFFKTHPAKKTAITKIRVSTKVKGVAGVRYTRRLAFGGTTKAYSAPAPAYFKKAKKGWKAAGKVPAKAKKDLGGTAKSRIVVSGEVNVTLKRAARCSVDKDSYFASVYDPATDRRLEIQIPRWHGYGSYPALAVGSLAALYSNLGQTLDYETGQPTDADQPSGDLWVQGEGGGGGIVRADMARVVTDDSPHGLVVSVDGYWNCGA